MRSIEFKIAAWVAVVFAACTAWAWERQTDALEWYGKIQDSAGRLQLRGEDTNAIIMSIRGVDDSAPWRALAMGAAAVTLAAVGVAVILFNRDKRVAETRETSGTTGA